MSIRPRNFSTLMLLSALTLSAGAALLGSGTAVAEGDDLGPCKAKKFTFSEVGAACKKGGTKAAKEYMKSIGDKAEKKTGKKSKCKDCHEDLKDYSKHTDDAVEEFKQAQADAK
jgi:hypothetical protein